MTHRSEFRTTDRSISGRVKFGIRNVKTPRNIVGPIVRRLRGKHQLTQPQLVAKLNLGGWDISRETLAKLESQIRWVADFEIVKLATALGVSPGDLLEEAQKASSTKKRA